MYISLSFPKNIFLYYFVILHSYFELFRDFTQQSDNIKSHFKALDLCKLIRVLGERISEGLMSGEVLTNGPGGAYIGGGAYKRGNYKRDGELISVRGGYKWGACNRYN